MNINLFVDLSKLPDRHSYYVIRIKPWVTLYQILRHCQVQFPGGLSEVSGDRLARKGQYPGTPPGCATRQVAG